MRKPLQLKNILWKEGKHYVAQCLNVDVSSFGKTKKEASKNLQEALVLYFEDIHSSKASKVERPEIFGVALRYA
ncbi:MAG: type II toxin-antitoxin system HicB family antitoxin [bacterium]|nr:type II toxin-antitoxin system HicB family antitoxin [bacterium]